jgi:hypothetical protein
MTTVATTAGRLSPPGVVVPCASVSPGTGSA